MKQTFILFWNPAISSFKMTHYFELMRRFHVSMLNWSIWDHENAKRGDRFFMIRCGQEGPNGLVMSGYFLSKPYCGEDWSGRGREVYYIDCELEFMGHPDASMLTPEVLTSNFPDFNWFGGHSGRLFSAEDAPKLEMLYQIYLNQVTARYMARYDEYFDEHGDDEDECTLILEDPDDEDGVKVVHPQIMHPFEIRYHHLTKGFNTTLLQNDLRKRHGNTCELCGYHYTKIFGTKVRKKLNYIYCGDFQSLDWRVIEKDFHCICKNCYELLKSNDEFYKYQALAEAKRISQKKCTPQKKR